VSSAACLGLLALRMAWIFLVRLSSCTLNTESVLVSETHQRSNTKTSNLRARCDHSHWSCTSAAVAPWPASPWPSPSRPCPWPSPSPCRSCPSSRWTWGEGLGRQATCDHDCCGHSNRSANKLNPASLPPPLRPPSLSGKGGSKGRRREEGTDRSKGR
jgi:hypothetical protein